MKHRFIALVLIITALALLGMAEATEPLESRITAITKKDKDDTSNQLCSESQETLESCYVFIKGFLKGALLTDAAIIRSIDTQDAKPSFSQRAINTRLGSRAGPPTALAGFCLPEEESISEISKGILSHIEGSEINSHELARRVYQSLKVDYPCE